MFILTGLVSAPRLLELFTSVTLIPDALEADVEGKAQFAAHPCPSPGPWSSYAGHLDADV